MNMDAQIFNNILADRIQQCIELLCHDQVGNSSDTSLVEFLKISVIYHIKRLQKKNHMITAEA